MNNPTSPFDESLVQERQPESENIFVDTRDKNRGLTKFLKAMQVGEVAQLGEFSQTAVYPCAKNLGMKFRTKSQNGTVYIKRIA